MAYIIALVIGGGLFAGWAILTLPPKKAAAVLINSGPILLMIAGGVLTLFKRGFIGIPLVLMGLSWWRRSRGVQQAAYTGGRTSRVQSLHLEMELDHDTGEMDGWLLSGSWKGTKLSSMTEDQLTSVYVEISDDPESVALLESFLDRYHSGWRESGSFGGNQSGESASSFDSMTKEEAYRILGVEPGASDDEIHRAWRRLVKAVHPDSGGSAFLTAKINAARDLLLG